GLPLLGLSFFTAASMMITIPSGVQVFCWIATIWNGAVRLTTSFLFAAGAVITFVMGGVTGVMLASVPFDLQVHDTFFVVAHFHYVLFGAVIFPLFAGFYHWFPKLTGRLLSERLGRWNAWLMLIGFHVTFLPQHQLGFLGMPRRVFTYLPDLGWGELNLLSTIGAFILALGVLLFLLNAVWTGIGGAHAGDNPWDADSLEWATSSPPPNYNFQYTPSVDSRYPLWQRGERTEAVVVELRSDRRETTTTSVVDAIPESRLVLPGPTPVPFLTAVAIGFTFLSVLADPWLVPVGALLTYAALVAWTWPSGGGRAEQPGGAAS
ncbi:MAG: cbb3-type cytochrome c oxidase subunit I, partial [Gemmatimonadetes bacterium]|nr:cbb3-type cytochrome c oxidase subunit I [Gemmatimonadota bacterium]